MEMSCNLTPVPGGVGRTTVLSLMKNVVKVHYRQIESELNAIHNILIQELKSRDE